MKDVAFAPGASAVILDWIRHRDDESSVEHEYLRIKILKDDAKKYADIEIPYIPGITRVAGIKARTILPDGTIRNFNGKFYDKLVVKMYGTRVMNKTFTLPDAVPGSVIEYTYTLQLPTTTLINTDWSVQRELPILREKLSMRPYLRDVNSYYAIRGVPGGRRPVKTGPDYVLELQDVAALPDEPFSPPTDFYAGTVLFYYTAAGTDAAKFWSEYLKDSSRYIESFSKASGLVKSTTAELTAGAADDAAKLRKIYARVQSLRNLTYEMEKSTQEEKREKLRDNNSVTDVLKNGYGYRTELNRTFLALARSAGLDAQPVYGAQRDEFFNKNMPDASGLEEFVTVMVGGVRQYFDPGTAFLPFGMLSWDNVAVPAVVMGKKQDAEWLTIPPANASQATVLRSADLRLDGESLVGTIRLTATGHEGVSRRWEIRHSDDAEMKKTLEDEVKTWLPEGSTVKVAKITGATSAEEPLIADFDVTVVGLGASAGSRFVLPLSVFTSTKRNVFAAEARETMVFFKHPYQTADRVTITLPEDLTVDVLPQPTTIGFGDFKYTNTWKAEQGVLTFTRDVTVLSSLYARENYAAIRAFFSRVNTADQDTVVLKTAAAKASE